jgi:parallel beta-helix repeat protein
MTNASDHDAILFDNNTFDFNASCASGANSKIHLSYSATAHSGVTISNNTFKNGSCDGVHSGTGVDILNNEFANLCDVGGNHTDNIQFEGATGGRVAGNWIHESSGCTTQGITSYDSGTHNVLIENNVVDIRRQWGIEWYDDDGSTIRHNTVVYHGGSCYGSNPCGEISIDTKGSCPGTTAVNDNIATAVGGACPFTHTKNMVPSGATGSDFNGTPTFVGGSAPTTFAGFALTCASSGHNAASDGTNVGAITGGEPACSSGVFVDDTFSPPPPPSGFVVDSFS